MQIVFHCGVHGTDHDGLLKTLLQNREWLLQNGVEVVSRNRHRGVFESALNSLRGGPATPDMEEMMLDAILDNDGTQRVICSQPGFLGVPDRAITPEGLMRLSAERMAALANLFPSAEVEFFIGLKNPATLIPYCISRIEDRSYQDIMAGVQLQDMRWAPTVRDMVSAARGRRLVIWSHEDTPLIWPEVVRAIATMPGDVPLKAGLLVLGEILQPDGIRFIRDEMAAQERVTIAGRRDIFARALEQYVRPEMIETTVTLPGWTQDTIDELTAIYDRDLAEIAGLPGVEFIVP
ncbi:hypothetical protein PE067_08455 [Paracoccus sp. DMF-8]|uniref:hypothetical protein n=1 Tax=Paracoccus sp. DMF-8 TaxID=3019445 RepID=UPI0023E7E4F0|nr:hypothetical protein [Paracoccus sp. DMF-8]MDF3606157.1 hypothetical protein [Paracoccus sp. DMF-8]